MPEGRAVPIEAEGGNVIPIKNTAGDIIGEGEIAEDGTFTGLIFGSLDREGEFLTLAEVNRAAGVIRPDGAA